MTATTNHLNASELRKAFSTFMTGVTVVTTRDSQGQPVGFTANSFTSVSLEPPLLLVCPGKGMNLFETFAQCQHFAVNILSERQQDISNTFATFKGDRFAGLDWQADKHGSPLLSGVCATFSCHLWQQVEAGDHLVLIGHIDDFSVHNLRGLGYSSNGYFSLGMEHQAQEVTQQEKVRMVGAIIEHDDGILLERTADGLRPPQVRVEKGSSALTTIRHYLKNVGLHVELGQVYSIFDSQKLQAGFTYYRASSATADTGG